MKNVDKIKCITFISLLFLIAGCNFINSVFKCNDNNSENTVFCTRISSSYRLRETEQDIELLFDSSFFKKLPSSTLFARYYKIISHEKYLKYQSELELINKIFGVKSESLRIHIEIYEKGNFIKSFDFFSDIQVFEYITMMHDLLGEEDGYVTIERYLTKKGK